MCVLGLGLIGGSLLRAAVAAGRESVGYNRSMAGAHAAQNAGYHTTTNLTQALTWATERRALIVLAVPMPAVNQMLNHIKQVAAGCPLTAHLVWEQIRRARHLSTAEVFRMEYAMSLNCCRHPEFPEGVRARLIDKDNPPHWHWPDIAAIPDAVVNAHFDATWEGEHPLADL